MGHIAHPEIPEKQGIRKIRGYPENQRHLEMQDKQDIGKIDSTSVIVLRSIFVVMLRPTFAVMLRPKFVVILQPTFETILDPYSKS